MKFNLVLRFGELEQEKLKTKKAHNLKSSADNSEHYQVLLKAIMEDFKPDTEEKPWSERLSEFCVTLTHDGSRPVPPQPKTEQTTNASFVDQLNTIMRRYVGTYQEDAYSKRTLGNFLFNNCILLTICLVAVAELLRANNSNLLSDTYLEYFDVIALSVFSFELVVKVIASQWNVLTFLTSPWNMLDALIVIEGWLSKASREHKWPHEFSHPKHERLHKHVVVSRNSVQVRQTSRRAILGCA